jgi:dienelactone hydrolase
MYLIAGCGTPKKRPPLDPRKRYVLLAVSIVRLPTPSFSSAWRELKKDSWGDGETCQPFCDWLNDIQPGVVSLKIYPDAHHGFDRKGSSKGFAPYAKDKIGILKWNQEAAHDSRERAVAFLRQVFGL